MPSGAKKRKAAKKKNQKVASTSTNPSSTASLGDEDLKHHESDGDHNSEHHLTEGEDEEVVEKREEGISRVEGNESVGDVGNDSGGVEKRAAEEEGLVQIEGESKPDDEFENKKGGSSSGSSSSSSSSDDDSPAVEKDIVVIDNAPAVDIVEAVDSSSEGPTQVTHITPVIKIDNSAEEAASEFGIEEVSLLDEKVPANSSASADNYLISDAVESELKENGERKSSSLEDNARLIEVIEVVKNLAPDHKKDEVTNVAAASDAKESAAPLGEDKLTLSYNTPRDDAIKEGEHAKDSEVLGSSDKQPLIASAPLPVQTTSWKSCCGLLEVFAGSNR